MYSFDLKNVVPSGGLTCLFAKATIDESNLWHRRLGHINFKTMNKLVRGNLVRGLPSKLFENDHTCVACQKGKQHKASCKTKLVSSISQPLQMLHMDLFGPTSVRSINHKTYCLVVTDDFSRFSWVFFFATKDETSGILKIFITGIENQINHKIKIIRCDNGTEFKNNDINQFCGMKGIKREFSVARTPQQNRVAERKNRTLIEAVKTMLADSLLPATFWVEAVNTVCYVQNRDDEGFLVRYSINSKAFRVFNPRTRKVEENMHITFLENKPNVVGSGPDWLFDIDLLTKSMTYEPVTAGNQTNRNAGVKDNVDAVPTQQYILLPFFLDSLQSSKDAVANDAGKKTTEEQANKAELDKLLVQQKEAYANSTNRVSIVTPSVSAARKSFINDLPTNPLMPDLEDTTDLLNIGIFSGAYDDEDMGTEADLNNLETTMNKDERGIVVRNKARLVAQGYTQEEGIDYDEVFAPVARIEAIRLFLAYASFMGFIMYQMDVKSAFLYGTNEEDVYVCQPPSFEDPQFPNKVYKVEKALYGLHQALRAWYETLSTYLLENGFRRGTIDKTLFIKKDKGDILLVQVKQKDDGIFISQEKYVADILKKFDFVTVKTTSTPIETDKALLKDEAAEDVDVYLYRSMIGSLMYIRASRPDIMFTVCACARFQVTPKVSHLHAVKRIFRYLKGQPKLGLWYPRDLPFDLEAFYDSDYAGASLDRKSTREAEYVVAANCYGQVLWIQNQMLDYGFNFMNTKINIDNESTICIVKNPVFHSKTKHIEIRYHFIRDSYEKKLIQVIKIHIDHNVADLLTKTQKPKKAKRTTEISQSSGPIHLVADETVYKEWEDRMERAATIASSLEAEQDSGLGMKKVVEWDWENADIQERRLGNIFNAAKSSVNGVRHNLTDARIVYAARHSLLRIPGQTSRGSPEQMGFMIQKPSHTEVFAKMKNHERFFWKGYTTILHNDGFNLQKTWVLDLEKAKTTQAKEITSLKKRVKQLEKRRKSRTSRLKKADAIPPQQGMKIEDLKRIQK
ncbi:putative ribonuclease H-like domain-containing protein [Tanacetum coccineum]|uniref:Ribonuclease H-like domain-containing protein n=1 Tax=Tanacetum coccineum TaxID=301880 RepID=A0ABQ4WHE0_9ASTR